MDTYRAQDKENAGIKDGYVSIPLDLKPVNLPAFDQKNFLAVKKGQAPRSINELIREKLYSSYVIGRWNDQIVLGIRGLGARGVPAVWMVDEAKVKAHLRR